MRRTHFILQPLAVISIAIAWLFGAGLLAFAYQISARISQSTTPPRQEPVRFVRPVGPVRTHAPSNAERRTPNAERLTPDSQPRTRGITVEPRDISLNGQRSEGRV